MNDPNAVYRAVVQKIGIRPAKNRQGWRHTICLQDIFSAGFYQDHVWITRTSRLSKLNVGDLICFTAIMKPHRKEKWRIKFDKVRLIN